MNPLIKKKAKVILFPIEGKEGVVYGMDNKSGALVPFNFSRGSIGTYFDSNLDMHIAESDIPRVDFSNYGSCRKLLVESERTNLVDDSMFKTPFKGYPIRRGVSIIEKGVLGFFDKLCLIEYGDIQNYLYTRPIINIGNRFSFSSFIYNPNNYPTNVRSNECIAHLTMGSNIENIKSGYVNVKDGYNRNFSIATTTSDSDTNNIGWRKWPENIEHNALEVLGYQIEVGDVMTSFIPTYGVPETRKADSLSINISTQSSVLICDTKEKQVVDVQGLFKVEDYIQNDGLTLLAIFDELADKQKLSLLNSKNIKYNENGEIIEYYISNSILSSNLIGMVLDELKFVDIAEYANIIFRSNDDTSDIPDVIQEFRDRNINIIIKK